MIIEWIIPSRNGLKSQSPTHLAEITINRVNPAVSAWSVSFVLPCSCTFQKDRHVTYIYIYTYYLINEYPISCLSFIRWIFISVHISVGLYVPMVFGACWCQKNTQTMGSILAVTPRWWCTARPLILGIGWDQHLRGAGFRGYHLHLHLMGSHVIAIRWIVLEGFRD